MTTKISTANIQASALEALSGGGGGGTTVYDTFAELPLSGVETGDQAFIVETNRLYMWTGVGWFNIGLLNTNPTITSGPNSSYQFSIDGTPTVLTLVASDPEGLPITWSYQVTSGSLANTATVTQSNNVFTITPSTNEADVGTFSITFTASDGVNIATAVSSFTLVFGAADQYYKQSIILTTGSANNTNNNVFIDSSNNNFTITRNGNTTQGTFSPYSPAGWSGYFDGSGDNIAIAANSAFTLGTNNFSFEAWIYPTVVTNTTAVIASQWGATGSEGVFQVAMTSTGDLNFQYDTDGNVPTGTVVLATSGGLTFNQWQHILVTRVGSGGNSIIRIFINGVLKQYSSVSAFSLPSSPSPLKLGMQGYTLYRNGEPYGGYISNFRMLNGSIPTEYATEATTIDTSVFTPPTNNITTSSQSANSSHVVALLLQDNRFKDNSTNNFAITRSGDTTVASFSPFDPLVEYNPSDHGGSAYFDGTGDSLASATQFEASTSQSTFTIDGWIYPTSFSTLTTIIGGVVTTSGDAKSLAAEVSTSGNIALYWFDGAIKRCTGNSVLNLNSWNYFAIVVTNNDIQIYVNKTTADTRSGTTTLTNRTQATQLGVGVYFNNGSPQAFSGYLADLRLSNVARSITDVPSSPAQVDSDTRWLLNFTNAGVYDDTGKVVVETTGNTVVNSSVVKYGDTSMLFDGNGDYLIIPYTPLLSQTSPYTVEFWFYPTYNYSGQYILGRNAGNYFNLKWTGTVMQIDKQGVGIQATGSTTLALNQWHHYAMTYDGTTTRLFANGVLDGSVSGTGGEAAAITTIGYYTAIGTSSYGGRISEFRFTRGHARYTSNFTPPTAKLGFNNAE